VNEITEGQIILALKKWATETNNHWNDGWTRYHYLDKLLKVKGYVDDHLGKYEEVQERRLSNHKAQDS